MSEENLKNNFIFPSHDYPDFATREKWAIIALPTQECPESVKIPSENINNFVDRLRKQYEENIEEIKSYLADINKEIEIDIRLKSSVLKDELNMLLQSVKNKIETLTSFRTDILLFEEMKFNNTAKFCEKLFTEGTTSLDHFYDELKQLEKYRSDKFKVILKHGYEIMEKSTFKLPKEIQLFFEEQILHINQMLLTNLRNYKELHTNLKLIFINDMKLLKYNINQYQNEWKTLCIELMTSNLQDMNVSNEEINDFFEKYKNKTVTELILLFRAYVQQLQEDAAKDTHEIDWINKTKLVIDDIDEASKQLLQIFESIDTYFKERIVFTVQTFKHDRISSLIPHDDKHSVRDSLSSNSSSSSDSGPHLPHEDLENLWNTTLQNVIKFIHKKFVFVKELKEIISTHTERMEELDIAVQTDIEQNVLKNDRALMEKQEMALNIALDTLRQETNEKNMVKKYKKLLVLLNKMEQSMEKNKEAEIKVVAKYQEYVDSEAELYLTTINKFIEKYSEDENEEMPPISSSLGVKNKMLLQSLIDRSCEIEDIVCLQSIVMEHLNTKLENYPEKCSEHSEHWMQERTDQIELKFKNKVSFHQMRYKRIELEVYNVRLAELKKHEERLRLHVDGIEKAANNIDEKILEFQTQEESNLNEFIVKLTSLVDDCCTCGTSVAAELCVKEYKTLITAKSNYYMENIKKFTEQVMGEINQILTSNYNFLNHIKLFCEGGNYSPTEVTTASKTVLQQDSLMQKKKTFIKGTLNQFQKKVTKIIEVNSAVCEKRSTEIIDNLIFKETIATEIENIQSVIKNTVYKMKYNKKKIDTIYEKVAELAQVNNFSNVNTVIKYASELINHCKEYQAYLEETDTPSKVYNVLNTNAPSEPETPKSKKSSKPESKKSKKEACVFETYILFENILHDNIYKFMPSICVLIDNMFNETQDTAKIYYGKQYVIEDIDIPSTYNDFMTAIMKKCKYYYLQCIQVWALAIQEFAETTRAIFQFVNEYCNNYLQYSHNTYIQILKNNLREFYEKVKHVENTNLMNIKNIQNQLKPLHGYPGNNQLLIDLQNKMDEQMDVAKEEIYAVTAPYEEFLTTCRSDYHTNINAVIVQVEQFKIINITEDFCHNMINQVKDIISNINVEDFDITLENIVYFIVENPETSLDEMIGNTEKEIRVQAVEEECKLNAQQLKSTIQDFSQKNLSTYETWTYDIERVIGLYTVKYE